MTFFSWSRWLRSLLRPEVKPIRRRRSPLRIEQLETRLAPATFTWTGLGGDDLWSDAKNWNSASGLAPSGSAASLDDLVFQGNTQLTTKNDLVGATFNSITISSSGFDLTGNAITLGSTAPLGSGKIIVNGGSSGDIIAMDLQLGGAGSAGQQVLDVGAGSALTISGELITATAGVGLTKVSTGTLTLSQDNSTFTGAFTISAGVVDITNTNALGISSASSNLTVVQAGAQLTLDGVGKVTENLTLNGFGLSNSGAVESVTGTGNTLVGTVTLDSDTYFGGNGGTTLTVTGVITDLGAGHSITKVGAGELIFTAANTYHGSTTIDNGILQIQNGQALGITDGSAKTGVTVNEDIAGPVLGTLQINDPTGVGFTVANVLLTLNGDGFGYAGGPHPGAGIGAIDSLDGNNVWTGNVILGTQGTTATTVTMAAETGTAELASTLTFTGVIQDPATGVPPITTLFKIGLGTVVFTHSNTYTAATTINAGILEITDSQAMGPKSKLAVTTVNFGASLELAVDNLADSITNTTYSLNVYTPLVLNGPGNNNVGALYSATGINIYLGNVTFASNASIGVDPDPNPTPNANYFTNDYSLTMPGGLAGGGQMQKVGGGQLILPNPSAGYTQNVDILQGWITIQNSLSLGGPRGNTDQNNQPVITVEDGGSLQLLPPKGKSMTLTDNFVLYGVGITHPFGLISEEGAILSLAGVNTISGNVELGGLAGVGSQLIPAWANMYQAGQLYLTGAISETPALLRATGAGNDTTATATSEVDFPLETGSLGGTLTINADSLGFADDFRVYLGGDKNTGTLVYDSSLMPYPANPPTSQYTATIAINYTATSATIAVTQTGLGVGWNGGFVNGAGVIAYGPLTSTEIEIVVDQKIAGKGNTDGSTKWTLNALDIPTVSHGTLVKLGQQLVGVQGPGTYHGGVDVREGVLVDQNPTGMGTEGTVTVESGATLALANVLAGQDGNVDTGFATWDTNLVLNGPGNTTLDIPNGTTGSGAGLTYLQTSGPLAPFKVLANDGLMDGNTAVTGLGYDAVTAADADFAWTGNVELRHQRRPRYRARGAHQFHRTDQ